jgi:hypothetical protein
MAQHFEVKKEKHKKFLRDVANSFFDNYFGLKPKRQGKDFFEYEKKGVILTEIRSRTGDFDRVVLKFKKDRLPEEMRNYFENTFFSGESESIFVFELNPVGYNRYKYFFVA